MEPLLLLVLLLGIFTYFIIKRSVASLTRTPVWILWLTIMTPALIWSGWTLIVGEDQTIPLLLLIAPFVLCTLLYLWLIQRGRREPGGEIGASSTQGTTSQPQTANSADTPKNQKESPRPINKDEEARLRNCFPWGIYYLQNVDYSAQAVLCRGKLRTNPEQAYERIRENIEQQFGDRFLVIFQEGLKGEPFFALVPNPRSQSQNRAQNEQLRRPGLALALVLITLLTTTGVGATFAGVSLEQMYSNPDLIEQGLPYAVALMGILGVHELSHYLSALYYKIRATLPYFIPVPFFLGTFGAFIQMRSPLPHRKALFDVSIAGPLGGLIVTLPVLIWGLSMSEVVPLTEDSGLLNIESLNPQSSLLMTVLSQLALGSELSPQGAINLHPIAIAGYIGLVVTALNLMPVGQLDGGHIVHAMYGQRTAAVVGQVARLLMIVLAFSEPGFLIWAIILFFMPIIDEPALNDVTELDNWRDLCGLLSLTLLASILVPAPEIVMQWLN